MFLHNILDITWDKAYNATVSDTTGKEYIDFTSGIFCANIGHANEYVAEAISNYSDFPHSYTYNTKIRESYLNRLCEFTGYEAAALFSAGTEATEAAWKMARQFTGKVGVWGLKNAFHGKTLGALIMASRFGSPHYAQALEKTCMLIMEPYTAITANFHKKKDMDKIRGIHNDGKVLLTVDEIQAAYDRDWET